MLVATFGVVRTHAVPAFQQAMAELCSIASKATGVDIRPYTAPNYRELANEVKEGSAAIAWLPPVLALDLAECDVAHPIALPIRSGMSTYSTAFIVRDRVPEKIENLRGKRVAWVDRESSSGHIVPRLHLASLGFDPHGFFSREEFLHSHIAVVDAVASGRADVGATFFSTDAKNKVVSAGWTGPDGSTIRSVKIVATAGPIPNDVIVAAKTLPPTLRASIQRWLLHLDPKAKELFGEIIHSTEFRLPVAAHFGPLRSLVSAARARGALKVDRSDGGSSVP